MEITLFQGISKHWSTSIVWREKKKNAFEECQACLKYLLLLLEDAAEKTPFMWRRRFQPKATFCHSFASWWSLSAYPALSFSVLFSVFFLLPLPPCSFLCRLIGRSRLKCHPALPAQPHIVISLPPPPSSRRASLLIRQGYLGGPSPSKKPSTVTQKWTLPAVRGVKEDALKKDAGKLFNQIRSLYTMKCGVSAVHALEPAEIGALLLIKYKLVFNRILFQEVCDYLAVDWPTVSAHFKAGNSRELCAALCWSSILFWDICFSFQHGFVFILSVFQTNRRCFFCAAFQELREVSNTVYWISTPSSFIHQNYIIFPHPSRIIAHF